MEFRRINDLPPYVFAAIDGLKAAARKEGRDVIDMGFGNPDLPSPQVAVDKLAEAAQNPRNHRYSSSKGIPKLRSAAADLYLRKFGVEVDPETEVVAALTKLKSYLDYGTFQPIQIASIVAMNEVPDYPAEICSIYESRRNVLCDGLNRIGWDLVPPKGTMFVWAPIPEPYKEMGVLDFSKYLVQEADVATSPGVGFGPGGDGHVRFALIENEQRINQALRNLKKALPKLG